MKTLNQYIEETNEAFLNASPSKKRIMIAKDVILRLNTENIIVNGGNFMSNPMYKGKYFNKSTTQFKTVLNNSEVMCRVCAKGALFCSVIGRINNLTLEVLEDERYNVNVDSFDDAMHQKLLEYFSKEQIDLIETAFEGFSYLEQNSWENKSKALNFFNNNRGPGKPRLIAICKNIVENKGTFTP